MLRAFSAARLSNNSRNEDEDGDKLDALLLDGSIRVDQRRGTLKSLFTAIPQTRCSSSPQPSASEFVTIIDKISNLCPGILPSDIVIFDLRAERHFHLGDCPVVLAADIVADEEDVDEVFSEEEHSPRHSDLIAEEGTLATIARSNSMLSVNMRNRSNSSLASLELHSKQARNEKEVVNLHGMQYLRFPTANNCTPDDQVVDLFVKTVLELKANNWVHFHCHGGKARSATFMAMFDAVKRARFPGIPPSIYNPREHRKLQLKKSGPTPPSQLLRIEFVNEFYAYVDRSRELVLAGSSRPLWTEVRKNTKALRIGTI